MVRLTHAYSRQWFFPGLSPNRWRTCDCISIMFDRGNSDMKTTVLAAALLALLTSPAAAAERGPDRGPTLSATGVSIRTRPRLRLMTSGGRRTAAMSLP